jgi:hypothetical protein
VPALTLRALLGEIRYERSPRDAVGHVWLREDIPLQTVPHLTGEKEISLVFYIFSSDVDKLRSRKWP